HRPMPQARRSRRIFTYEEALETFPVIRDLTAAAVRQVEAVVNSLRSRDEMEENREEVETACERILEAWAKQVVSFGCEAKGRWLVDWDSGDGYYCWQYPEETLGHFHDYEEGFAGRIPIN
ncbi:MAG TPA: DUF2203 family protein, partial [Thermoanaerobaculia bacterium]|nr:DUF2203 family protein [Thermoanaerobaculia bacterium]